MIAGAGALGAISLVLTTGCGFPAELSRGDDAVATLQGVRSMLVAGGAADAPHVRFREAMRSYYGEPPTDSASAADDEPPRLLWVDGTELSAHAEDLLETIAGVEAEGIDPAAYRDSIVERAIGELEASANAAVAARSELLLSDVFLRLADRVARGSDETPMKGLTWDIERDSVDHALLLAEIADGGSPDDVLERLRSSLPWYEPMVDALEAYREVEKKGGWSEVPGGHAVAQGDTSDAVVAVRTRLAASPEKRERELAQAGDEPNVFDARLAEAVAAFQERHGIAVDSTVGPGTIAAMNVSVSDRIAELQLNLDRLRRLPRDFGSRTMLVNVAGYELVVLEDDDPVMRMNVVVGQPEWRTNIFQDELEYLEVNPYWHVPASIEAREILPAILEDPDYLQREHMVVVDPEDSYGPPIPADEIDWDDIEWFEEDSTSFPYDFRQEPGPWNALGSVKFMFPNGYGIYLHDSPAEELFQKHARAFSHGCIRLERPLDLARYVMQHASDTSPDELDGMLAEGQPARVELTDPIPVFIAYFTAWVEPDGAVHFYRDVYDLDAPLPE